MDTTHPNVMFAPTPPEAPHQPGDPVKVLHWSDLGTTLSPTVVRECVQNPRTGVWLVAVDCPAGVPEEHRDVRSTDVYSMIAHPDFVLIDNDRAVPVPA